MPKTFVILSLLVVCLTLAFIASSCGGSRTTNPPTTSPRLTRVDISGEAEVYVGLSRQLTATAAFEDGSKADVTSQVAWTSSKTKVATISASGAANAYNPGITTITAALDGIVSQPFEIKTVGQRCLEAVPYKLPNLVPGGTLQLQARLMKNDGTYNYVFPDGWTSTDAEIATVSSKGLVTGLKAGTTSISSSYSGFESLPTSLTVVAFSSITVSPALPDSLSTGSKRQFIATIDYPDGRTEDVTAEVDWRSSNLQVVAFTSPGEVTAATPGYVTIQAFWEGISSSPVTLSVVN